MIHTCDGCINFETAIFTVLLQSGYIEEESDLLETLADMAENHNPALFDVIGRAITDTEELVLVHLAQNTIFGSIDGAEGSFNFWSSRGWDNDERWRAALQIIAESEYASDWMKKAACDKLALHPGYVYLISCKEGYFKIGRSANPEGRLIQFRTLPPFEFNLEHIIPADDDREAERQLHSQFSEKRVRGEWFTLDEEDVEFISSLSEYKFGKFHHLPNNTGESVTQ